MTGRMESSLFTLESSLVNRTNSYEMDAFTPCINNEPLVDLIIPIEGAPTM